ncbi:oligosaccharide flippase family protein [Algibacter pacificus]|uniref:oligosaccharide flippase family protein n=1 Tax=Algibacter pacificus TaxID=2599389 RepID=UPI00164F2D5A|nr:oligosaccharide flippase family protein [Algibacter pacificus]
MKSSGLIGLVQVFRLFFALLRNKVVAILLGTGGYGIWGLYQAYIEMISSFSTLGIGQSGVREIAANKGDHKLQLTLIYIIRVSLLIISSIISVVCIIFSKTISKSLFNTEDYYLGVIVVSIVIIFNSLSNGQKAILNGLREIKYLAISQIYGAVLGSLITIVLIYFFGLQGIPWGLFVVGLLSVLFTWYYLHKLKLEIVKPDITVYKTEFKKLIKTGLGYSGAAIISTVTVYLSRIYLNDAFDLSAVGIYQASWTISNMYIGIILTAMGIDFMPRIMEFIDDDKKINSLVNEQMELGVLIASVGVVAVLAFSSLILNLLYSEDFVIGREIIKWQVLGVGLRVLGFPFSHVLMAKNKPLIYVIIQAIHFGSDYLLLIFFSSHFGFDGLGVNYFVAYILYLTLSWFLCYKLIAFKPSKLLYRIMFYTFIFILITWLGTTYLQRYYSIGFGCIMLICTLFWVNYSLNHYMGINFIQFLKSKIKKRT